jgi:hypothetical protein
MHIRVASLMAVLCCASAASVQAQDAARSADLRKLDFFVGRWDVAGRMRDDPAKPLKPISGGETCAWAAGGFAVTCTEKTGGEGGGWEGVYILGYDQAAGTYFVHGIEKPGSSLHAVGKLEGDRWTWFTDAAPDGSRLRYTFAPGAAGSRTLTVEAGSGDAWAAIAEVTYSRKK